MSEREPARRRAGTLLQRSVETLGRAIIAGAYAPDSLLPVESDLAARLAVGRNVVRETVKILADKRLVRTERRTGTTVLPEVDWDYLDHEVIAWIVENDGLRDRIVDELNDLRAILEPEVAALAARTATSSEVLRLFEALERMEAAAAEIDVVQADILFHERLFAASHHRLLFSLMRTVEAVLRANFALAIQVKRDVPQFLAEHRALAEAIRSRDPDAARAVTREIIANNTRHLRDMRALRTA